MCINNHFVSILSKQLKTYIKLAEDKIPLNELCFVRESCRISFARFHKLQINVITSNFSVCV